MLQTMQPRVPVAGVKRRWAGRPTHQLQDSSSEVSSSGIVLSPPSPSLTTSSLFYQQPATATESVGSNRVPETEKAHLWDLDLHARAVTAGGLHDQSSVMTTLPTTTSLMVPTQDKNIIEGNFIKCL